jgi:hypothetical protein
MMMRTNIIVGLAFLSTVIVVPTGGQAGTFIYPEKGQNKDQQELDQFTCYKWAKEQTGIDPNQQMAGGPSPAPPEGGQAMRGAMGGAALGAVGGAIAGDAGKGAAIGAAAGGGMGMMRHRRTEMQHEQSVQQSSAHQQQNQQEFNRAYGVCLEGKGYKVG